MAKHAVSKKVARQIQQEAEAIARSRQLPGQTKEQTRLIADGIRKGIEQHRRQQAEKERELDKALKKEKQRGTDAARTPAQIEEKTVYRQHWLPWSLLLLSWLGFAALLFFGGWA